MDTAMANGDHKQSLMDRYDISLEKLEPNYIEKCTNVNELEKILKILRSGEEGHYPHIEKQCEDKILQLAPMSRSLRKETPLILTKEMPDKDNIVDDIKNWTAEMKTKDSSFLYSGGGGDENIPPVRSGTTLSGKIKTMGSTGQAKGLRKAAPRDYKEWDKIISNLDDADEKEEPENVKDLSETLEIKKPSRSLLSEMSTQGLSDEEKVTLANREKDKGNEAFRSGDFMEAIVYYNRSLSVLPITATYNNRALAYIRVNKWSDAVTDCNRVLRDEPENIKATLRRACAYKSLRKFKLAKDDLDAVLKVEPQNKRAQDILKDVKKELVKQDELKAKGHGNRMVIEETDGESDEEIEEIIIQPAKETKISTAPAAEISTPLAAPTACDADTAPPHTAHSNAPPAGRPRRIIIEEESDDNSPDDERASSERTSSAASSNADHSSTSPDFSSESSPRDEVTKTKKTVTRNSSLLSIIQQNIATSTEQPASSEGSDSSERGGGGTDSMMSSPPRDSTAAGNVSGGSGPSSEPCDTPSDELSWPAVSNDDARSANPLSAAGDSNFPSHHQETTSKGVNAPSGSQSQYAEQDKITEYSNSAVTAVIKVPALPAAVESLKAKGNGLFKSGQYGEAISYYTRAINNLHTDHSRTHHQATLYSNRSACYIKTGDCRAAVNDCSTALDLTPHNAKALLRRATANEMLERYMDAYVDYRHVINIDSSAATAYTGASRCERMLSDENMKWRANVPKIPSCSNLPRYEVEGAVSFSVSRPAADAAPSATPSTSIMTAVSSPQVPSPQVLCTSRTDTKVESNEDKFIRLKEDGNKMVAKGDHEQAISYYTQAIDIYPDRVAPYSNRALCHLKSNNSGLAVKDCDTVLTIEPGHVKALFRRAQANKAVERYKESLADLMHLLKLDSKNGSAKKEIELVKAAYRAQLQSLQKSASSTSKQSAPQTKRETSAKPTNQSSSRPPTRVLIEEGSDSESEKPPPATPPATLPATSAAAAAPAGQIKTKSRHKKKKQAKKSAAARASQSQQPAATATATATAVPTLSADPSAYEFTQAWTALRHTKDTTEPYARLLKQISPNKLTEVLSNKLEAEMLEKIISCLDDHFGKDELNDVENYLKSLARVPRFSMIRMFMSPGCKSALENILEKLKPSSSLVDNLRVLYGI